MIEFNQGERKFSRSLGSDTSTGKRKEATA